MTGLPVYDVLALRYATFPERKRQENFQRPVNDPDAPMPLDYFVWILRNDTTAIVVDTGCTADVARRRGRTPLTPVPSLLTRVGLDARTVPNVVITHVHYDHLGSLAAFPAATVHLQARELAFARDPDPAQVPTLESDDLAALWSAESDGRLRSWDGDGELVPGVSLHLVGGHTPGLQVVRVHTAKGWAVLASDSSHFDENRETRNPFPVFDDETAILGAFRRCEELADDDALIFAGHDPKTRNHPRLGGAEDIFSLV